MHLPPIPRFLVKTLLRSILVLIFVGLPVLVFFLREYGVGFGLREQVGAALSGEGFQTSLGKLSLDPFKGLVAKDVTVTETRGNKQDLAKVEHLVVSINFRDFLNRKVSIDRIALKDSEVSIPLAEAVDSPRLNLQEVNGQCVFLPGQLRISHLEAEIEGIRVSLSGLLSNPEDFRVPEQKKADSPSLTTADSGFLKWLVKLSELSFPGLAPEIRAELEGDLADLSTLRVNPIVLRSGPIVAPSWQVEGIEAEADYENGAVILKRLVVRDKTGTLTASARWREGGLDFEASSTLQAEGFRGLLADDSPLKKLHLEDVPELEVFGHLDFSGPEMSYRLTGSGRLGRFSWGGIKFNALAVDFAGRDGTFFARDLKVNAGGGELLADVFYASDDFRMRLSNTIAPTMFLPLMGPNERDVLGKMEFKDLPYLEMELQGPRPDLAVLSGAGSLRLGRTAMRGSWLDWANSSITIEDQAVTYSDISLGRGQAKATGAFVYDFGGQQVILRKVRSTMPPVDVMMWIDPKIAKIIEPYRFRKPPEVQADGVVHMKRLEKNDLALKIKAAAGLDYDLLERTLRFGATNADVDIKGKQVLARVRNAKLMGGDVQVKATVSIDPENPVFGADVELEGVDFAKLTKLYFDYDESKGVGSGNFSFRARMGQEEKLRGQGSIRVEDGHVFGIPILGPLSTIIDKIIPGAGLHAAKLATADFKVEDEKIITDNLAIQGVGFSLLGNGDIFFTKDRMDMSVRINARGLPGIVLFPVSKLFEYVSTGSVSEPEWRPKIVPRFGTDE